MKTVNLALCFRCFPGAHLGCGTVPNHLGFGWSSTQRVQMQFLTRWSIAGNLLLWHLCHRLGCCRWRCSSKAPVRFIFVFSYLEIFVFLHKNTHVCVCGLSIYEEFYDYDILCVSSHLLPPPSVIFAGGSNGSCVRCLSFSSDGSHLGTVCDDGWANSFCFCLLNIDQL